MNFDWLKSGIAPLDNLISILSKQSKTNDVLKKQVLMELRNNLNLFKNAFLNNVSPDTIIDLLSNDAIQEAIKQNFTFKKLKAGTIEPYHVHNERNKRYVGWNAERIVDKIDEKIVELKLLKKMNNGSVTNVNNNVQLMISNLYFRMKLLADFIQSDFK
jgi:hypothetical protein